MATALTAASCLSPDVAEQSPDSEDKVVGGRLAFEGEFPNVVSLARPSRYRPGTLGSMCTGTLISPNTVLTAAHCVGEELNGGLIVFSATDVNQRYRPVRNVASWIVAPNYDNDENHDVALVKFSPPMTDIEIVPLNADPLLSAPGVQHKFAGYGGGNAIPQPHDATYTYGQLRTTTLPSALCPEDADVDEATTTCFMPGRETLYFGDSGGPGFVTRKDGTVVQGTVTSRGIVDEDGRTAGVANVQLDAFIPWILQNSNYDVDRI